MAVTGTIQPNGGIDAPHRWKMWADPDDETADRGPLGEALWTCENCEEETSTPTRRKPAGGRCPAVSCSDGKEVRIEMEFGGLRLRHRGHGRVTMTWGDDAETEGARA